MGSSSFFDFFLAGFFSAFSGFAAFSAFPGLAALAGFSGSAFLAYFPGSAGFSSAGDFSTSSRMDIGALSPMRFWMWTIRV